MFFLAIFRIVLGPQCAFETLRVPVFLTWGRPDNGPSRLLHGDPKGCPTPISTLKLSKACRGRSEMRGNAEEAGGDVPLSNLRGQMQPRARTEFSRTATSFPSMILIANHPRG